jgi:hypothetical protein
MDDGWKAWTTVGSAGTLDHSWPLQACDAELTRRLDPAIIGGVTKGIVTKYLADANSGSRRILRPDCRSGISRGPLEPHLPMAVMMPMTSSQPAEVAPPRDRLRREGPRLRILLPAAAG